MVIKWYIRKEIIMCINIQTDILAGNIIDFLLYFSLVVTGCIEVLRSIIRCSIILCVKIPVSLIQNVKTFYPQISYHASLNIVCCIASELVSH